MLSDGKGEDEDVDAYRNFMNAGALKVNGECSLHNLWSFKGSSEEGSVTADRRYDFTSTELQYEFAHLRSLASFIEENN